MVTKHTPKWLVQSGSEVSAKISRIISIRFSYSCQLVEHPFTGGVPSLLHRLVGTLGPLDGPPAGLIQVDQQCFDGVPTTLLLRIQQDLLQKFWQEWAVCQVPPKELLADTPKLAAALAGFPQYPVRARGLQHQTEEDLTTLWFLEKPLLEAWGQRVPNPAYLASLDFDGT